jgi:hypothetical protein
MFSEELFQTSLGRFSSGYGFIFVILMFLFTGGIGLFFWIGWWRTNRVGGKSFSMTGGELAPGDLIAFHSVQRVHDFMLSKPQPENTPFKPKDAAVCRETGRVFPNARDGFGVIRVKSSYPNRRWKGSWVLWKELSRAERSRVEGKHGDLSAYESEGLYADPFDALIMGWQKVPGTELQVLIVEKPH